MRTTIGLRWSALALLLAACQTTGSRDTIASLRSVQIEIKEEKIEGGLEKAMDGYRRFLEQTPDSALSPEAIRRLADLKVEREYGTISGNAALERRTAAALPPPERAALPEDAPPSSPVPAPTRDAGPNESPADPEKRTASAAQPAGAAAVGQATSLPGADDLERAGAREAIVLYQKLLTDYPRYERNDEVLYQMSRAYEELGQVDEAMKVMDRLVLEYPKSRYGDEVQFRRAEYFFTRKRYLDAEDAYGSIVTIGDASSYYQLALYKLGWTFYKQELYGEALDRFIALLDCKVAEGYDFAQTADEAERKRMDDTFRVISLSFSNTGNAGAVVEYFTRHGKRRYEDSVYSNLGEFYFDKRRYADAAATYNAFISRNPFHKASPQFAMRVVEIHLAGAFPSLVIDAKKQFVSDYALTAGYWEHFKPSERPEVLAWLKTNLMDLARHYHALYQSPQQIEERTANFQEALRWYREFLASFPTDPESPAINYLLADLLLESRSFDLAAAEYERTAYAYPRHERSSQAGYAAIFAYRQHLASVATAEQDAVKREVVRSSLGFADTYPEHEKAAVVLGAAADDLYEMREYGPAMSAAQKLIRVFPGAGTEVVRQAWLVVGHSAYELRSFSDAETAYVNVLAMLPAEDTGRDALNDNLAAAIYKQGEQANAGGDYPSAAKHFLRVGRMAPTSTIRATAEYDAAAALIQLKDWKTSATVLTGFRDLFPGHVLQPEVTKKIAYVFKEDGQLALAAQEYERIEQESPDDDVRREALLIAADLHGQGGSGDRALEVYRRYVEQFPHPVAPNLETRGKIADALKKKGERDHYIAELRQIVVIEAGAAEERTTQTRMIAGKAALVLAEESFDQFAAVKLVKPFEANLSRKKELMKTATQQFSQLLEYEVGEVSAAGMFYLAEIYARFSEDLKGSERPEELSALEREEYELAIEEQAFPFEEKAIEMHKRNLELISLGVYNEWISKSLEKLARFVPARYDKPEEESPVISSLDHYTFAIDRPQLSAQQAPVTPAAVSDGPGTASPEGGAAPAAVPAQYAKPAGSSGPANEAAPAQEMEAAETPDAVITSERVQDATDQSEKDPAPDAAAE